MADLSTLSEDEIRAQLAATEQQENAKLQTHWNIGPGQAAPPQFSPADVPLSEQIPEALGGGMENFGAHLSNMVGATSDADLKEREQRDAPLRAAAPLSYGTGETLPMIPATMGGGAALEALAGASKIPQAVRLAEALSKSRVAAGAAQGGAQGAVMADPGQKWRGAEGGALAGAALPMAGAGASALVNGLKRTPAAQTLLNAGVDLDPGRMNPGGLIEPMAEAGEHVNLPWLAQAREAGPHTYQRAVIQAGAVPGTQIKDGALDDMLEQAYQSYQPQYAQVAGHPILPVIMNQGANTPLLPALQAAVRVPGLQPAQVKQLQQWVTARFQALPQNAMSEDYTGANSIRSAIRGRQRQFIKANNSGNVDAPLQAQAMDQAEGVINKALESQLPPDKAALLRQTDQQYGQYKVVENAVARSRDNAAGLTPAQLSAAVAQHLDSGSYARGAGGPLRDLARAGQEVFANRTPPTGARAITAGALGWLGATHPHATLPALALPYAATVVPGARRAAQGTTGWQQALQGWLDNADARLPQAGRATLGTGAKAALVNGLRSLPAPAAGTAGQ